MARAMQGGGDELAFKLVHNVAAAGVASLAVKMAPHVPRLVHLLQVRQLRVFLGVTRWIHAHL